MPRTHQRARGGPTRGPAAGPSARLAAGRGLRGPRGRPRPARVSCQQPDQGAAPS